ncbi:tail assembly chaperone [Brevibacterium phage LuckyBarnes]|uniref:Tail assembly chaperone n=1 Tax=Brevibacterium phage LuckyBarnes TaxID=2027888 RepID=A0A249XNU1_9CAUD|nr:tail assembly chaperone [Brevibacterium phage LuckyBarnes]ASZ73340.1 tail assembly chaperone [Brevibacterium phage LuckyBarnes]
MTTKFNPDEFIAGIQTAETTVTVFMRADISGKLQALEKDLALFPEDENGEADLTAGAEKAELLAKRDEYEQILRESARELTLRAVDNDEVDRLTKEARKAASEKADQAAKDAAGYAREECRRAEVGDPKEIKEVVRRAASQASNAVLNSESGYYVLAAAIVDDEGQPIFTPDQAREAFEKLGAPQMATVQDAFYDLTSTDPASFVPKYKKPGRTDEA